MTTEHHPETQSRTGAAASRASNSSQVWMIAAIVLAAVLAFVLLSPFALFGVRVSIGFLIVFGLPVLAAGLIVGGIVGLLHAKTTGGRALSAAAIAVGAMILLAIAALVPVSVVSTGGEIQQQPVAEVL